MLQALLGNATAEKVRFYLEQHEGGYAMAIADTFGNVSVNRVQRQLARFERADLLVSALKGRTRLYSWNPRYPFLKEVRALFVKASRALPRDERSRYARYTSPTPAGSGRNLTRLQQDVQTLLRHPAQFAG
jgi:hypothetical protein